jgi:hypothetical protein
MLHQNVADWPHAQKVLQMEIQRQNSKILRTTGLVPQKVWDHQILLCTAKLRPSPCASLLDLHLSLRTSRKVYLNHLLEFDGREFEITPTTRKSVTVLFHPEKKFWVLETPPTDIWPNILGHFSS